MIDLKKMNYSLGNKMKIKKCHNVGRIPQSNIKIVGRGKIDNTKIHDHSLSWLGTGTLIRGGGVNIIIPTLVNLLEDSQIYCIIKKSA